MIAMADGSLPRATAPRRPAWGVLGGMGPLASAAFLQTVYEASYGCAEQEMPVVFLMSDPTIPDRTSALLADDLAPLRDTLVPRLDDLVAAGADRLVMCCMTVHAVVPRLPDRLRQRLVSLVDLLLAGAATSGRRGLLLCSDGARLAGLYESSAHWPRASLSVVRPGPADQARAHAAIYELKRSAPEPRHLALVDELVERSQADCILAGCTEFHLLGRAARHRAGHWRFAIDPLVLLAERMAAEARRAEPVGRGA